MAVAYPHARLGDTAKSAVYLQDMKAFEGFELALVRVQRLIEAHRTLHGGGKGRPQQQASDVLRGALILAVAALDAFILDSVVEAVPHLAKQGRLGPEAHKIADAQALLGAIAAKDPPRELGQLAWDKFNRTTFQKCKAIEGHLRAVLGYEVDWTSAVTALHVADDQAVKDQLDEYVRRRDRIAHSGDLAEGTSKARPINKLYVVKGRDTVRAVAVVINHGLDAHL